MTHVKRAKLIKDTVFTNVRAVFAMGHTTLMIYSCIFLPDVLHAVGKDIVYIIDKSGSVQESDFDEGIDFVYNVTKWLEIGPNDFQVSIVTYSTRTNLEFHLNRYSSNSSLLDGINSLKGTRTTGYTYTYDAIDYVRENSFLYINGGRSNTLKTVIVMTDGLSNSLNATVEAANNIRSEIGAEVFSIGIGAAVSNSNDELRGIASDPDSYYVHYVDTYVYLCNLVPALVPKLDSNITSALVANCPTPPTPKVSDTTTVTSPTMVSTDATSGYATTDVITNGTSQSSDMQLSSKVTTADTDNTIITVGVAVGAVIAICAAAAVIVTSLIKRKRLLDSEDKTILAAVQQYQEAPMGQRKHSFVKI